MWPPLLQDQKIQNVLIPGIKAYTGPLLYLTTVFLSVPAMYVGIWWSELYLYDKVAYKKLEPVFFG
jgi:hypothetical protein